MKKIIMAIIVGCFSLAVVSVYAADIETTLQIKKVEVLKNECLLRIYIDGDMSLFTGYETSIQYEGRASGQIGGNRSTPFQRYLQRKARLDLQKRIIEVDLNCDHVHYPNQKRIFVWVNYKERDSQKAKPELTSSSAWF